MKTIAVISQKGGTGKTTLAINLAIAGELANHKTMIFDLDPQASSRDWYRQRGLASPEVVALSTVRILPSLKRAEERGVGMVFFDTAPHAQKEALEAVRLSDLTLIPCRPSLIDLRAIRATRQITTLAAKPAMVVLTQTPPTGPLKDEAVKAIQYYQLEVAPVGIGHRAIFVHSFAIGKGVLEYDRECKASQEIEDLFAFLAQKLEMTPVL